MSNATSKGLATIALGADHGGYPLKETLKSHLLAQGYLVVDCGTNSTNDVDYPEYAVAVAQKVAGGQARFGIMVDGAGIGSAMAANKVKGARAALCYDVSSANNAREHNNANVLTLGAGLIGPALAKQIADKFLTTECTADRHLRRVQMIDDYKEHEGLKPEMESVTETIHNPAELSDISDEDIVRIAQRVGEIVQAAGGIGPEIKTEQCSNDMVCQCGQCLEKEPDTIRQFLEHGVSRIGISDTSGSKCVPEDIAKCIDHTILKPDATVDDIVKLCSEAKEFGFAAVCVSPSYVPVAAKELSGSSVKVCTVVGFPSGAHMPEIKAMETRRAIRDGAQEIDMVINVGALKSGNDELVYRDIRMVTEACEDGGATSKVIIEAALLNQDEKVRACTLSKKARANYVKTSTGFGPHGATAEDVDLMSQIVAQAGLGVKAAGGIKSFEDAKSMIKAGATRLGASAGIEIVRKAQAVTISN